MPAWNRRRHYAGDQARTLAYILVLDTINFSFWGASGGYWRLAEGLRDAFLAGAPLWEPGFLCQVDEEQLSGWVGELPMMSERARALRELGEVGVLDELVQPTAYGTAATLARRLHSFADIPDYAGREVPILKRAQIAAADLHGAGVARFGDMDQLTCFADYKLPQALRHLGVLEYSPDLARRVDSWQELEPEEPAEVEIRAATVIAVERLRERLEQDGRSLRAFEVDWMLWELSQGLYPVRPHHRVRTIHY